CEPGHVTRQLVYERVRPIETEEKAMNASEQQEDRPMTDEELDVVRDRVLTDEGLAAVVGGCWYTFVCPSTEGPLDAFWDAFFRGLQACPPRGGLGRVPCPRRAAQKNLGGNW